MFIPCLLKNHYSLYNVYFMRYCSRQGLYVEMTQLKLVTVSAVVAMLVLVPMLQDTTCWCSPLLSNITIDPSSAVTLEYTGGWWWWCVQCAAGLQWCQSASSELPIMGPATLGHTRLLLALTRLVPGVSGASKPQCQKAITTIISSLHFILKLLLISHMHPWSTKSELPKFDFYAKYYN